MSGARLWLVLLLGGGCALPGAGHGAAGGRGQGGAARVNVQVGGTHVHEEVELRPKEPCRGELDRAGVAYTEAEFLLRVQYGDERAARAFLRCGILGEVGAQVRRRALLRAARAGQAALLDVLAEAVACERDRAEAALREAGYGAAADRVAQRCAR